MPLRICFQRHQQNDWRDDDSPAGGHFVGGFSVFSNIKLQMMLRMDSNISVHGEQSMGHVINPLTDSCDGCVGRLQNNQSDVILSDAFQYPTFIRKTSISPILLSDKIQILSSYDPVDPLSKHEDWKMPNIENSFNAYSPFTWLLILCTFSILFSLMIWSIVLIRRNQKTIGFYASKHRLIRRQLVARWSPELVLKCARMTELRKRTRKSVPSAFKSLLSSAVLRVQYFLIPVSFRSTAVSSFSLLVLFFPFYIAMFFKFAIHTTAISTEKPDFITSYEDILTSGRRPNWPPLAADDQDFKNGKPNTSERKIWERAVKLGLNRSSNPQEIWFRFSKKEDVVLSSGYFIQILSYVYCTAISKALEASTLPFIATSSSAVEKRYTTLMSGHLNERRRNRINTMIQRRMESGMDKFSSVELTRQFKITVEATQTCGEHAFIQPESPVKAIAFKQYWRFFVICFVVLLPASLVLLVETFSKQRKTCPAE